MLTGSFPGMWWRPDDVEGRVPGVLSLNHDGLSLDLIGSFERLEMTGKVSAYPVLHGTTTGGLFITLVNALVSNVSLSLRALDIRATRLSPSSALVGGHIDDPVGAAWSICSVELERMTAWAAPLGFEQSFELTEDRHLKTASFRYEVPDSVEVRIPAATLVVGPRQQTKGDLLHEAGLTVAVEAEFTLEEPATIDKIIQAFLKPLLNLVILATQRPTAVISLRVAAGMEMQRDWLEVIQRRQAPENNEHKRLSPADALFLLPDLLDAAPDGLSRWFGAAATFERPFDLISAVHSSPHLFLDHRFLNAATALESYHEQRFNGHAMPDDVWERIVDAAGAAAPTPELADQVRDRMATMKKPSFRDRVNDLLEQGGVEVRSLLPDPDGVARRASRIRNPLAHGGQADATWRELFDTTDELLLILQFHFLLDAGFSPDQAAARLRSASRSFSGLWLRGRIDEASAATQDLPEGSWGGNGLD